MIQQSQQQNTIRLYNIKNNNDSTT